MRKEESRYLLIACTILMVVFGISYAFFSFKDTGKANKVLVGKIHLKYSTNDLIAANNIVPRNSLDPNVYSEFTISGLNEYTMKDVFYTINLKRGDVPNGKTESNRIQDSLLRFALTLKIDNGEEELVFNNLKINDLTDKQIISHVIPAGTSTEKVHTYKLYMWVDSDVEIGNSNGADYTLDAWQNAFASVKVMVNGNLIEKDSNSDIKVTFDPDGGSLTVPYAYYQEYARYGDIPKPTKSGYVFDGYWTDNLLDVSNLTNRARETGIRLDENNHVYDSTPNSDVRSVGVGNWQLDVTPGIYRIRIDYLTPSTSTGQESDPDWSKNPLLKIMPTGDESNTLLLTYTRNVNYVDEYFTVPNNVESLAIFLRLFDGVADVKLYKKVEATDTLIMNEDHTLTARWMINRYEYNEEYTFDGTNYLNTEMRLFSNEHLHKNFHISFEITEDTSSAYGRILGETSNDSTAYPGIAFRVNGGASSYFMTIYGDNKETSTTGLSKENNKIQILRLNDVLYYSLNDNEYLRLGSYDNITNYNFNPLIFGAYVRNGEASYYFTGKLSNIVVEILNDNVSVNDYNMSENANGFTYSGDYPVNGTSILNTGVKLFSEENIHRNFYISFDLKKNTNYDSSTTPALVSTLNSESSNTGFRLRKTVYGDIKQSYVMEGNLNTSYSQDGILNNIFRVRIVRVNDIIYYSFNNQAFVEMGSVSGNTSYSNIPLVFGGDYNDNGSDSNHFYGVFGNIDVEFLDNNVTLSDFPVTNTSESFRFVGDYEFTGKNFINSGVKLFSNDVISSNLNPDNKKNYERNFYISFEIKADDSADAAATLMSSKNELSSPYQGVDFRHDSSSTGYYSKATVNDSSVGVVVRNSKLPLYPSTTRVRFLRIENKLYYSLNNGSFKEFNDYTGFESQFDLPVYFGASIYNASGVMRRFFIGTLSNMTVEFIADTSTVADYES